MFDGENLKFLDQIIQVSYPVMKDHNKRIKGCQSLFTFNSPLLLNFLFFENSVPLPTHTFPQIDSPHLIKISKIHILKLAPHDNRN